MAIGPLDLRGYGDLLGNGPDESGQFTGNGDGNDIGVLASGYQSSVTFAEPDLCFPADVLKAFGLFLESQLQVSTDLGRIAVGPGRLRPEPVGHGCYRLW